MTDFHSKNIWDVFARVRQHVPRVHCLTNVVAQELTANVLLAAGAIPSMTIAREEVETFAGSADALLVNLGTLDAGRRDSMAAATAVATEKGIPWVLDPVKVDRSPFRADYAMSQLAQGPSVLKANEGELETLKAGLTLPLQTVVLCTGAVDRISRQGTQLGLRNGAEVMTRVTAMGCSMAALVAACCAVEEDHLLATLSAAAVFAVAGEIAHKASTGPGSFTPALLDTLYTLEWDQFEQVLRLEQEHTEEI
ncbi:hydroxyethylthiazole kinase [Pseudovibrio sp. SPO723]|uniref:hydroxyethylthiazole kinase n=1 Tax=Nesiotobacter zosterae TaxID=392721 RepID=UPI0029C280E7|nr:hydroxyethylthiazole kinase [Pseudovibrio sp. SPO723]MDX5594109.1 hydroxyethylthiazole kinase [Pseudovibrio sp. SPO723]